MYTTKQKLDWQQYCAIVIRLLNDQAIGYGEAAEHYSFRTAFEQGMPAAQSVADCIKWLEWE